MDIHLTGLDAFKSLSSNFFQSTVICTFFLPAVFLDALLLFVFVPTEREFNAEVLRLRHDSSFSFCISLS